jgi:hypothetical protein
VKIERPARYAKQLASHLGHKIQADETSTGWLLTFPNGTATLDSSDDTLTMTVNANDYESEERMKFALVKHLKQFTTKLPEYEIVWN